MSGAIFTGAKGGLYGGSFDSSDLDANTRAVMMDERWTTSFGGSEAASVITYAFPTLVTDYTGAPDGYPTSDPGEPGDDDDDENPLDTFAPASNLQKAAAVAAMGLVASYTQLTFVEAASPSAADATFRFAAYAQTGSESRFPPNDNPDYAASDSRSAGDTWLGGNGTPPTAAFFGTDHFNTVMHEMGHAFGLKHGHDDGFGRTLSADRNDNEFSVMTYASYLGADAAGGASEAWVGSAPQSYMMYDIAALQAYYGANFGKVGTEAVYSWDSVTGQQYINGVAAAFTGASETGKILSTVWTQGASATYDLSNFNEDQLADLRPGQWLRFSSGQIADLNDQAPEGTAAYQAQGNIYNALLYRGDARSLVGNLITGSGNDRLIGNDADNGLTSGAGNDTIDGGLGDDTISAGSGADRITFGAGRNLLRDQIGDLDGDAVLDFANGNAVQILGTQAARAAFGVINDGASATFTLQDSSFTLHGAFADGDFIAAARGSGEDGFTHLAFIPYLPVLAEYVTVDAAAINGIADSILLTGDGMVSFTVTLEAATTSYRNMVGSYRIAADGSIADVSLLFDDVLGESAAGSSMALGTPGAGEGIGFFLVQNGAAFYESLPGDLSFRAADGDTPWVLHSASLGDLTGAAVFHSVANYNPGGSVQVLSGLQSGDEDLWIGFEDLTGAVSDNDFQDVVLRIHETETLLG